MDIPWQNNLQALSGNHFITDSRGYQSDWSIDHSNFLTGQLNGYPLVKSKWPILHPIRDPLFYPFGFDATLNPPRLVSNSETEITAFPVGSIFTPFRASRVVIAAFTMPTAAANDTRVCRHYEGCKWTTKKDNLSREEFRRTNRDRVGYVFSIAVLEIRF